MTFDSFCQRVARDFIQSVMVVDDQADLGRPAAEATPVKVAVPNSRTFANRQPDVNGSELTPDLGGSAGTAREEVISHALDGMRLTRSFAKLGVACSIYVPQQVDGEEEVADTVRVARHADVVVLDWRLGKDATKAMRVIRDILAQDASEKGRLRLIAVYTGETGLAGLRDRVAEDLAATGVRIERSDSDKSVALVSDALRIVFINKAHAYGPLITERVDEEKLPERLVAEFAKMSLGIMPAVTLGAITAIRNATHHVLAKFRSELDGALASHRALLKAPEASEAYATELVAEELRAILETAQVGSMHADIAIFRLWASHKMANGHVFHAVEDPKAGLSLADVSELLEKGEAHHNAAGGKLNPVISNSKIKQSIPGLFHANQTATDAANLEFSRMAALKREAYGKSFLPADWMPTLTLGTIILRRNTDRDVFACIQPVCDSVRLTAPRKFPLVPLRRVSNSSSQFSIVIRLQDGSDLLLDPDYHPYSLEQEVFAAAPPANCIRAEFLGQTYLFKATSGCEYEWLADLKGFVAQRLIQRAAGQVDRVGLDEYEWLRKRSKT